MNIPAIKFCPFSEHLTPLPPWNDSNDGALGVARQLSAYKKTFLEKARSLGLLFSQVKRGSETSQDSNTECIWAVARAKVALDDLSDMRIFPVGIDSRGLNQSFVSSLLSGQWVIATPQQIARYKVEEEDRKFGAEQTSLKSFRKPSSREVV